MKVAYTEVRKSRKYARSVQSACSYRIRGLSLMAVVKLYIIIYRLDITNVYSTIRYMLPNGRSNAPERNIMNNAMMKRVLNNFDIVVYI